MMNLYQSYLVISSIFKICGVIRNLQKYNSLSHNDDEYIILAFLLRALMEYTAKAYIALF